MICVVDYGVGNVQAIINIYKHWNIPACAASAADQLHRAERIVLPGVGAFDWVMSRLNQSGMREVLDELVGARGVPVLGICVGMQMMMQRSAEGSLEGLGWIEGDVVSFDQFRTRAQLPHMGWNDVRPVRECGLFEDCGEDLRYYFLHSFHVRPERPGDVYAVTDYHGDFVSAVRRENVYGVQFHPEKSHNWGTQLLRNFANVQR
jgi:glutamine amidotransferase